MSKVAMKRLMESDFYQEVRNTIIALDSYIANHDSQMISIQYEKWNMAKMALKHITGKTYVFTRDDEGFGLVNEFDCEDILFFEKFSSTLCNAI